MKVKARIRDIEKPTSDYEVTVMGGALCRSGRKTVRATVDIYLPSDPVEASHVLADLILREGYRMTVSVADIDATKGKRE